MGDDTTHGPPKPDDELTKLIAREWRQVYPCSQGVPTFMGQETTTEEHAPEPPENLEEVESSRTPGALDEDMVIQSIGITAPKSALLYKCPRCGTWNVLIMRNTTIRRSLELGSKRAKLTMQRQQPCTGCGLIGVRLHSTRQTRIVGLVNASKRKQVLDLRAVAEELNALQEESGEPATEHDANTAWFAMSKHRKQGKGRKYWGLPFRRWANICNGGEL